MSELQIIQAAIQGLATAMGGVNASIMTIGKSWVAAYEARTKEMAVRTKLLDQLTLGGQSIPLHVVVQPAPTEPTVGDGVADAAEEAAKVDGEQPQNPPPQPGSQV